MSMTPERLKAIEAEVADNLKAGWLVVESRAYQPPPPPPFQEDPASVTGGLVFGPREPPRGTIELLACNNHPEAVSTLSVIARSPQTMRELLDYISELHQRLADETIKRREAEERARSRI